MPPPDSSARLRYLDWTRGIAALIMLQGHVFHSFTRADLRAKIGKPWTERAVAVGFGGGSGSASHTRD